MNENKAPDESDPYHAQLKTIEKLAWSALEKGDFRAFERFALDWIAVDQVTATKPERDNPFTTLATQAKRTADHPKVPDSDQISSAGVASAIERVLLACLHGDTFNLGHRSTTTYTFDLTEDLQRCAILEALRLKLIVGDIKGSIAEGVRLTAKGVDLGRKLVHAKSERRPV